MLLSRRWPRLELRKKWLRREAIIVRPWSCDHQTTISHRSARLVKRKPDTVTGPIPHVLHNDREEITYDQ